MIQRLIFVLSILLIYGCAHTHHPHNTCSPSCIADEPVVEKQAPSPIPSTVNTIKLTETGFGAISQLKKYSTAQKELLAMRASKLDAMRSLSERLYGTTMLGTSRIEDLVLSDDHLRTVVDSLIRGAKVISTRRLPVGGYETVVELTISPLMQYCLSNYAEYGNYCPTGGLDLSNNMATIEKTPPTQNSGLYFLPK